MYEELLIGLRGHAKQRGCDDRCPCYDAKGRGYTTCSEELAEKAADAIEELSKYANTIMRLKSEGWYLQQTKHHDGYAAIATMPLPQPSKEEVQHRLWEWDRLREAYRCSCCDNYNADRTAFCPNCGAKMEPPKEEKS